MGRRTGWLAIAALLAACGSRGALTFDPDAAAVGAVETLLVATSRDPVDAQPLYTDGRDPTPHFARFEVSVPPDRSLGSIAYPRTTPPDPATDFLVTDAQRFDERAFVAAIDAGLAAAPRDRRDVGIFVHGFNTNFAEGLYRQAQIQHDLDLGGVWVHFAWPSAAKSLDYLYDLDSSLFSRDALEATIRAAGASDARRVVIVAHSMGAFLAMDTLRTMARTEGALDRIGEVVLVSPDIDVSVFERQAPPVLAQGTPIILLTSRTDRALRISSRLRGTRDRLGSIGSVAELGGLDVTVIDLSQVSSDDVLGHFKEATSPAMIDFIRKLQASGEGLLGGERPPSLGERGAELIQQGANILVAPLTGE